MINCSYFVIPGVFFLYGCETKDHFSQSEFPVIEMVSALPDAQGVELSGYVHELGNRAIQSASFNWFPAGESAFINEPRNHKLIEVDGEGTLSAYVDRDLLPGVLYAARLAITMADNRVVYSDTVHFQFEGKTRQPWDLLFTDFDTLNNYIPGFERELSVRFFDNQLYLKQFSYIWQYEPASNQWAGQEDHLWDFLEINVYNLIAYNDSLIYVRGLAKNEPSDAVGLWRYNRITKELLRMGDLPYDKFGEKVVFTFPGRAYFIRDPFVLYYLNYLTYQGPQDIHVVHNLPFSQSTDFVHKFFTLGEKGYILEFDEKCCGPVKKQAIWEFDPDQGTTKKLMDLEIKGHNSPFITGAQNYLLVGANVQNSSTGPMGGSIWKIEPATAEREFIGWAPFHQLLPGANPVFWNDQFYFIGYNFNSIFDQPVENRLYTLDLKKLAPL